MMRPKQKTAAIYARFSSDLQKDRSIDDQIADCEALAEREGFKVVNRFWDKAKSASTLFERDGALDLMLAAKARKFDIVIVESQSRLSRDPEDIAGIFKRLKYADIELHTVTGGIADDMKVGLHVIIDSQYLKNLASAIKRGQKGLVREGLFPGAVTYGYDRVPGKPAERVINQEHAKIVRRIFTEYADGAPPREIALGLTRDCILSPSGAKEWSHQSLTTGGAKATGILGNRLYIGELIWCQHLTVIDPDTGGKRRRARPQSEHATVAVPHLRIIDDQLWHAVQTVRNARAIQKFGPTGKVTHRPFVARSQHLLSGLLRCGACNGPMIITKLTLGKRYVACSAAHQKSTCSHRRSYTMDSLKDLVLDGMRTRLVDPKAITEAALAFHTEYAEQAKKDSVEKATAETRRNRLLVQIGRITDAIADSDEPLPSLLEKLKEKEVERVALEERLQRLAATGNVVTLHPNVIRDYQANVEKLHQALVSNPDGHAPRLAFRNMVDSIVVHPVDFRQPYEVTVYGRLSAIMGMNLFPTTRSGAQIIAEERGDMGNAD
jgi:site-specific DNA recombinase